MLKSNFSQLLEHRSFVKFWLARLFGTTGNQMLMVALAWHMYDLTSSPWDLGLVGLFQFLPAFLMALPAGHIVDRFHRGRIYSACMLVQGLVALVLVLGTQGNFVTRDLVLFLSVMLGIARSFQMPVQQSLTPLLVPKPLLQSAIALSSSGIQIAIIAGPAIGGMIYSLGVVQVYITSAALLLLSCLLTLAMKYKQIHHAPTGMSMESVLAGVSFLLKSKVLLGAISLDLFAVLLGGATALLPIYARDILHVGPAGLGILRGAPALGALLMSLILLRWPLKSNVGYKLLIAVAVYGFATMIFGMSHDFLLSMIALAVTGAADNISVVIRLTIMQLETPDEIRGRVSAVNSIFIGASNQLGEFESGATAALLGPIGSVVLGGVGTIIVALSWLRLFPGLAKRNRMI